MSHTHTRDVILHGLGHPPAHPESVPELPGLDGGCLSAGPEAGFAKRSKQHHQFRSWGSSCQSPGGVWIQRAIEESHKDTFSPLRPGRKTERPRHKERVVFTPACSIRSKQLKERSHPNTQEKQGPWHGLLIKDEEGGGPGTQAPSRRAGSHALALVWARGL